MLNAIHGSRPSPGQASCSSRDYERIERAIAYVRRHAAQQPDLATVARHVHLSEFHFQRLFTRWAGVSPKRFLQYLTIAHAKARIRTTASVLELSDAVGLSGPGRLHELFVTLEAVTPGDAKTGGAGMRIRYGVHGTPFGRALLAATERGICSLQFITGGEEALARLRHEWPRAELKPDSAGTAQFAARIFAPLAEAPARPLAVLVRGTNFQVQVWRALLALPEGAVTTYGSIARGIGAPAAARAVGAAVAANPVAYLIPCHRVLRDSGELGGYRWGTTRKAAILGREAAQAAGAGR